VTEPIIAFIDMLECVQEAGAIPVVFEDGLLFIAAGCDVIDGTGVFYAEGAGQSGNLQRISRISN